MALKIIQLEAKDLTGQYLGFFTCGIVTCLGWFVASFKLSCV